MRKNLIIITVIALLFCVVIVNTMADPSGIVPLNRHGHQLVDVSLNGVKASLDKPEDVSIVKKEGANGTALLSMLMVGLALFGLASIREGNEQLGTDRPEMNQKTG